MVILRPDIRHFAAMRFIRVPLTMQQNRCLLSFCLAILSIALCPCRSIAQEKVLLNAFAHNDYWHKRPLFDALDRGFTHVEADVYLRRHQLRVGHLPVFLKSSRTLESLYLEPIAARLRERNHCREAIDSIVLTIDFKSRSVRTYHMLNTLITRYKPLLSSYENGHVVFRELTLVITGHRPMQQLSSGNERFVFADGDLRLMKPGHTDSSLFLMASCRYSNLLSWKGRGVIQAFELARLKLLVENAHRIGIKVRLWASPEKQEVWALLRNCGVDLINTNKLDKLRQYLSGNEQGDLQRPAADDYQP